MKWLALIALLFVVGSSARGSVVVSDITGTYFLIPQSDGTFRSIAIGPNESQYPGPPQETAAGAPGQAAEAQNAQANQQPGTAGQPPIAGLPQGISIPYAPPTPQCPPVVCNCQCPTPAPETPGMPSASVGPSATGP